MAPRPRSYPTLAALLWIALAVCGLTAPAQALATPIDYGSAAVENGSDSGDAVVAADDLLAGTDDDASGDSLAPTLQRRPFGTAFRPLAGRDWLGRPSRFMTPFETGPPAA